MRGKASVGPVPQVAEFLSWDRVSYIGQKINITKASELTCTFFSYFCSNNSHQTQQ